LTSGLSADEVAQRPAPDKWSIQELAAHLADDELVGAYRIRMILSFPGTAIEAFDQDIWARTCLMYDPRPLSAAAQRTP